MNKKHPLNFDPRRSWRRVMGRLMGTAMRRRQDEIDEERLRMFHDWGKDGKGMTVKEHRHRWKLRDERDVGQTWYPESPIEIGIGVQQLHTCSCGAWRATQHGHGKIDGHIYPAEPSPKPEPFQLGEEKE